MPGDGAGGALPPHAPAVLSAGGAAAQRTFPGRGRRHSPLLRTHRRRRDPSAPG
eukprot:CAMPEP_0173331676 /NCGR_PEP_ID=MMETSP1144-20121109/3926_1 /TAXON_ID=483371 /ORGANISM="non described non described, Strain CCMP2298" /LENGTH=53 /DNA_ID=CAMNT_0014276469 /DNA_START=218 /DNA_END=379 /DNA_ORIENTATION=+